MSKQSHSAAYSESPLGAVEGQKRPCYAGASPTRRTVISRRALSHVPTKFMAHELGIRERTVNKWRGGEAIPQAREFAIICITKKYFLELQALQAAIDQALLEEIEAVFGPRNGHASRGAF